MLLRSTSTSPSGRFTISAWRRELSGEVITTADVASRPKTKGATFT
ncbi:MAG: hypothetical protein R2909_16825 [Gemmatimonadales bacterium]